MQIALITQHLSSTHSAVRSAQRVCAIRSRQMRDYSQGDRPTCSEDTSRTVPALGDGSSEMAQILGHVSDA